MIHKFTIIIWIKMLSKKAWLWKHPDNQPTVNISKSTYFFWLMGEYKHQEFFSKQFSILIFIIRGKVLLICISILQLDLIIRSKMIIISKIKNKFTYDSIHYNLYFNSHFTSNNFKTTEKKIKNIPSHKYAKRKGKFITN